MKFWLKEGQGECYYWIGYEDNGNNLGLSQTDFLLTLSTLSYIAWEIKVDIIV